MAMHRHIHPEPRKMTPERMAQLDRLGARWVFGIFCAITAIAALAGALGIAGVLALILLSVAISQITPREQPKRTTRNDSPAPDPKGLMRAPKITPEWAERLTGARAIACGIAALFLIMAGVGLITA